MSHIVFGSGRRTWSPRSLLGLLKSEDTHLGILEYYLAYHMDRT